MSREQTLMPVDVAEGGAAARLAAGVERLRQRRGARIGIANLRLLLGFAFIPAGLKKVLAEPFTAPENVGRFHEFLHAFHATGFFYRFVGAVQLLVAVLLLSQRAAWLGAVVALPVLTTILVFCWSTGVYPTASVVSLMFVGLVALLVWDLPRWRRVLAPAPSRPVASMDGETRAWQACGVAVGVLYAAACGLSGAVYRPRGAEWGEPAFYSLTLIACTPLVALAYLAVRRRNDKTS